jgi:hypothetical protein
MESASRAHKWNDHQTAVATVALMHEQDTCIAVNVGW